MPPATTSTVKLECSSVEGQTLEHFSKTQPITTRNAVGDCLYVDVLLGGEKVTCLLDTGSQVSTQSYETFQTHFQDNVNESSLTNPYIRLVAANGLQIPYQGVVELNVQLMGCQVENAIFFILKPQRPQPDPFLA